MQETLYQTADPGVCLIRESDAGDTLSDCLMEESLCIRLSDAGDSCIRQLLQQIVYQTADPAVYHTADAGVSCIRLSDAERLLHPDCLMEETLCIRLSDAERLLHPPV